MADQDLKPENPAGTPEPQPEPEKVEPVPLSEESQNLIKAFDQASLEVAAMPESNELSERRRKTKNRLRELSDLGNESEENADDSAAFEDDEGGLMDLLKEANLSKKQVGTCCGGVLVLFLLVGLIYGGVKAWDAWKNRTPNEVEVVEDPTEEVSSVADSSIQAGVLLGENSTGDSETGTGEDLGTRASSEDELSQFIVDFSKFYSSMTTDVNELLDQSTNREQTLMEYEQQLNYLIYVAKQNSTQLQKEMNSLEDQYASLEQQKATQEDRFFEKLRVTDAFAATGALNSFIADSQELIRLRAHYQARQKILSYYEQILENADQRLEDLTLNEEALIKGIQVVDISGSDLNLIIDESEL